jgi:hypothetical protein
MYNQKPVSDGEWNTIWEYDDRLFAAIGSGICTVLSSLLPTASIFVLYFIKSSIAKLTAIMGFTALFSLTLALLVGAKRADNFAATAA